MIVLLDSSALLAPFETGVDFIGGIRDSYEGRAFLFVPFEVLREIKRLSWSRPKLSGMARLALSIANSFKTLPPTGMGCDDALVYLAKTYKAAVATADRELRRRLMVLEIPVFYPAGEKRIIGRGWFEGMMRII